MIEVVCKCGKAFQTWPYKIKQGGGKYCSKECTYIYRKPKSGGKYNITKPNKGWFKKGMTPHNKNPEPQPHEHKKIRQSSKYKQWRTAVLDRDRHKCIFCGSGKNLNVDHVRPFAKFVDLRFDISNGRTLCIECHKQTPTYGKSCRKIFITGVCGYLGDAVVQTLLEMGHYVYGVDNLTYSNHYLREHELFDFYNMDVNDEQNILSVLNEIKPDSIIHLAAIVGDGACAVNPEMTKLINIDSTKFLADYCRSNGIRLIFASTCSVFGASEEVLTENSPTGPLSLYASTKLIAEDFIKNNSNSFIFRLGTLYGLSTAFARIRCDLVSNIMTIKSVECEPLDVFGGEQYRPILHVRDAARIFAEASIKKYKAEDFGTYILSDRNYKIIDMAKKISALILDMTGESSNVNVTEMSFEDSRNYVVEAVKSYRLGFKPKIDFDFGIKEFASFILSGRIKNPWAKQYHNAKFIKELA